MNVSKVILREEEAECIDWIVSPGHRNQGVKLTFCCSFSLHMTIESNGVVKTNKDFTFTFSCTFFLAFSSTYHTSAIVIH